MYSRIFFAIVTIGFLYLIHPLLVPLIMGAILAVLLTPAVNWLEKRKWGPRVASGLVTSGITLLVMVPTVILIYQAAKAAVHQVQIWKEAPTAVSGDWVGGILDSPGVRSILQKVTEWFPIEMAELTETLHDFIRSTGAKAAEVLGTFLASLPGLVMALVIVGVSTYFFLVDGKRLARFVRDHSIYPKRQTDQILKSLTAACRSVVLASVVSGACQATFYCIVLLATGTSDPLLVGVILFFASFIPVLGTSPVTFGIALHELLIGRTAVGVVLLVSAVIVGMMDNFIRPWFLKGTVNLHPLLAFVAAFGGLQTMGFVGVFLGPIVAALLLALTLVLTEGPEAVTKGSA